MQIYVVTAFSGCEYFFRKSHFFLSFLKEVFRHVRVPVDFEEVPLNVKTASETMIDQAALAIKRNGVGLKGNIDTNHNNPSTYSVNVRLLLVFK